MVKQMNLLLAVLLSLASCGGSGSTVLSDNGQTFITNDAWKGAENPVTRDMAVRSFSGISSATGIEVQYTCIASGSPKVKVTAPSDCIDYLMVKVEDGVLKIYYDFSSFPHHNVSHNTSGTRVEVTGLALRNIEASSASSITLKNDMHVAGTLKVGLSSAASLSWAGELSVNEKADFEISSAAKVNGASLTSARADIEASSSSSFSLSKGMTLSNVAKFNMSSTAKANVSSLTCGTANFEMTSAASCEIEDLMAQTVNGEVSSASSLVLSGKSSACKFETSSGGKVDASGMKCKNVNAESSTAGEVKAPKCEKIILEKSSGGNVSWQGSPRVIKY